MLKGFKEFIMRGNLVELAVAFIMATAFAVLVTETVNLLMSVLAKLSGNKEPDFSAWQPGGVPVGSWINAVITFVILAVVVYYFHRRSLQQAAGTARTGRGADPSVGGGHPAHRDPRRAARPQRRHPRHLSRASDATAWAGGRRSCAFAVAWEGAQVAHVRGSCPG